VNGCGCPRRWTGALWAALVACCLLFAAAVRAEEIRAHAFVVEGGEVALRDGVYVLDAHIDFQLSAPARQALESGVPLTFELQIELERPRWWLDESVANLTQRYRLRYHALSERYVLTNVNSGETRSFFGAQASLAALGRIQSLPLIDRRLLIPGASYEVWLRAELDIDELPAPLKTVAYMSPDWRLLSAWKVWQFRA
jgi:hypothetical protein